MDILKLIGRDEELFNNDLRNYDTEVRQIVRHSTFLVIGGAGAIGQSVTREIFKRNPKKLHIVDISENNLVELVRDIRSTLGYINGSFQTFAIDCGGVEFHALMNSGEKYDYVINLSALKHVRSEKDPFSLMRLIDVNIFNTLSSLELAQAIGAKKYFCVSTDKAANPVNMMGASKRIMEMFLMRESEQISISTARFANVAFSDGSLLHGFNQRFMKGQPLSAPNDVRRYFVTPKESGELCLMSIILGENRDVFFPKLNESLNLTKFSDIAVRFLTERGYATFECRTEDEARERAPKLIAKGKWPVYFFESDTTGEKSFEEFFTESETLNMKKFNSIGIIKNNPGLKNVNFEVFKTEIQNLRNRGSWDKQEIVNIFNDILPNFNHIETGKYLDGRM